MKKVEIGHHVKFFDAYGKEQDALVQAVWGDAEGTPSINIIVVSFDENKEDQYGRQIEHYTSVVHGDQQSAHGMYWARSLE